MIKIKPNSGLDSAAGLSFKTRCSCKVESGVAGTPAEQSTQNISVHMVEAILKGALKNALCDFDVEIDVDGGSTYQKGFINVYDQSSNELAVSMIKKMTEAVLEIVSKFPKLEFNIKAKQTLEITKVFAKGNG